MDKDTLITASSSSGVLHSSAAKHSHKISAGQVISNLFANWEGWSHRAYDSIKMSLAKVRRTRDLKLEIAMTQMLGRRYKGLDLRWEGLDKVNMAGNEKKDKEA